MGSKRRYALLIFLLLLSLVSTQGNKALGLRTITGGSPPPSGDWVITSLVVIDSETLIINGSIIVDAGGTLVIKNSTIYMNLAQDGQYWIEVRSGGNLTVINSTLAPYDTHRFFIRAYSGALFRLDGAEIWYVGISGDPTQQGIWIEADGAIVNNTKIYYGYVALYLDGASNVIVEGTSTWECKYGIKAVSSNSVVIDDNNQIQASEYAVILISSSNITIDSNSITGTVYLQSTTNSSISRNTLTGYVYLSSGSHFVNVTLNDIDDGFIRIAYSNHTRITGNRFITSGGLYFVESYRNTVSNNRIGLRTIYYYENTSDISITGSVGQVILIDCYNVTVSVTVTQNAIVGIELWRTNSSEVTGSTITNAKEGIAIWGSTNNKIYRNEINDTAVAIGIYGQGSSGNMIYLNLFKNTSVYDDGYSAPGVNQFDNGTHGNYWDDYTGSDTNNDGIGDTPYQIDNNSVDRYPLIWNPSLYSLAAQDFDGDGVANLAEKTVPYTYWVESPDNTYVVYGTDPYDPDTDGDGLADGEEQLLMTNPLSNDTDNDGLLDGFELGYQLKSGHWLTDPHKYDTDGDGLGDGAEVMVYGTNPTTNDTDGDGLNDSYEILSLGTDPLNNDTDGDGMPDGWEVRYELNPLIFDAYDDLDGDGLSNIEEYKLGIDPSNNDTDEDGMPDGWEVRYGLNPLDPGDALIDSDGDGILNVDEYRLGLDPTRKDIVSLDVTYVGKTVLAVLIGIFILAVVLLILPIVAQGCTKARSSDKRYIVF